MINQDKLNPLLTEQATMNAFQKEKATFIAMHKYLGKPKVIEQPRGADAGFPDFGFRLKLDGRLIDIHIEYKDSHTTQMGSMRDWKFKGNKFSTPDVKSQEKADLIKIMNSSSIAKSRANQLLKALQKVEPRATELSSTATTVEKDKAKRWDRVKKFSQIVDNYQIIRAENDSLGEGILKHYRKKFRANLQGGAKGSILIMMMKDKMWIVDKTFGVTAAAVKELASLFNADSFDDLKNLTAKLEVRVQPRDVSSDAKRGSPGAQPRIETMASFRLTRKPTGGVVFNPNMKMKAKVA